MESRFQRIEERLDAINMLLMELNSKTSENSANLEEHMRRTLANEERNELLREMLMLQKEELVLRMDPMFKFIDRVKFSIAALSVIGALVLGLDKLGFLPLIFKIQ